MKLPVLAARAPETTLCTYCPKLCRPACPVSTVEGRETVTPWGKMRAMGELIRGVAPMDASHAAPAFACTGCMRCFELCELDNPVAETLRDGRAEAFTARVAPVAAMTMARDFAQREASIRTAASSIETGAGRVGFLPGCTSVMFERDAVGSIANAVGRLDAPCAVVADRCCGLPLLEAGDRDGFMTRARSMAGSLAKFDRVVVSDAGCAHALRAIYPSFGITLPPVQHISETAANAIDSLPVLRDPPANAVYQDSCRLGRGLGIYDPPRAVLARLLGIAPLELVEHRDKAPCSGAGGLLPLTRPETSQGIAAELGAMARDAGGELVITSCAASRRSLAKAGVRTADFAALLARAVKQASGVSNPRDESESTGGGVTRA